MRIKSFLLKTQLTLVFRPMNRGFVGLLSARDDVRYGPGGREGVILGEGDNIPKTMKDLCKKIAGKTMFLPNFDGGIDEMPVPEKLAP